MRIKFLIALISMALLISACVKNTEDKSRKPNIIFIMADDLGYGDLGSYGGSRIQTPNLDKMAEDGIRFLNHYAGTSVCAPARSSLMTGLHTGHTQVRGNLQWEPYGQRPLNENTITLASTLKEAGYYTAMVGKWGLGVEGTSGDPLKQGFDYHLGYLCQVLAHNHSPAFIMENGVKIPLDNEVIWTDTAHWTKGLGSYPIVKKDFTQEIFTNKALEIIESKKDEPFFLYFSSIIPHDNGEAPKGKRYSDIPSFAPYENEDWTESEKGYAAMVTHLDKDVGKIMDKLKELGLEENTLVIFTSDNGGDSPDSFHEESNQPFRGHKRDLYEGGIRVPFIAHWKGKISAGRKSTHPSAFWDMLPTFNELAGLSLPQQTDGISIVPELIGQEQTTHGYLYFEFHEQGGKQAVIKDEWKLLRLQARNPDKTYLELFNIEEDISEANNLADQYPEKVDELLEIMKHSRVPSEDFPFGPIDEEVRLF
jgi:arylsulfatase A